MCWNAKYALLILFSTIVTYVSGLLLQRARENNVDKGQNIKARMNMVVALSFTLNLAVLFIFKYCNFVMDLLNQTATIMHVELNLPMLDMVLPVGISFYTFQALGYTVDVYRGDIRAEKNFVQYALFVSFFPQLVAGPIERSGNLLGQLAIPHKFKYENLQKGFLLMLWGYFLKIVIADRVAIFVDTVYQGFSGSSGEEYAGVYLLVASVLFAVQIYCDFAGYSTIAIGAAKILDINLMENFDAPYLATTVAGFWRRWHISLTSWFKDYLYIPLGGSRRGKGRKFINKMIVFLVSGLWHGADLSYVIWGGLNGLYQVIGEVLEPVRNKIVTVCHVKRESMIHKVFCGITTFVLVDFAWIFFRAESISQAIKVIKSIFIDTRMNIGELFGDKLGIFRCGLDAGNVYVMIICICILFVADICKQKKIVLREYILSINHWVRCIFIGVVIFMMLILGIWGPGYNAGNFIYFQF